MFYPYRKNLMCFLLLANTFLSIIASNERLHDTGNFENGLPTIDSGISRKCSKDCPLKSVESLDLEENKFDKKIEDFKGGLTNQETDDNPSSSTCDATQELGTTEVNKKPQINSNKENVKLGNQVSNENKIKNNKDQVKKKIVKAKKKPQKRKRPKRPKTYTADNIDEWWIPEEEELPQFGPYQDPKMYAPIVRKPPVQYLKEDPDTIASEKKNSSKASLKKSKDKQPIVQDQKAAKKVKRKDGEPSHIIATVHITRKDDERRYRKRSDETDGKEPISVTGPPEKRRRNKERKRDYVEEDE